MERSLKLFEKVVVFSLIAMMALIILLSTVELGWPILKSSPLCCPNILIRRDSGQTGRRMAPHRTDTRQRIRESLVQSESSPALDRQVNADHNCPPDTGTHSDGPRQAGSE
jgi:hypothetical protein